MSKIKTHENSPTNKWNINTFDGGGTGMKAKNKTQSCPAQSYMNIYVTGLPENTIKEDLVHFLEQFGDIANVKIPYRKNKGVKECKGHAKVRVTNLSVYRKLTNLHDAKFKGEYLLKFEPYLNGEVLIDKMLEVESRQVSIYGSD